MKSSSEASVGKTAGVSPGDQNTGSGKKSSTLLYVALGIALLVIGLLAGKLTAKKGKNTTLMLLFLFITSFSVHAEGVYLTMEEFETYKIGVDDAHADMLRKLSILESERKAVDKSISSVKANITKIKSAWSAIKNLYSTYTGLSSCISSTPPAGAPTIPSICTEISFDEDDEIIEEEVEGCASCFLVAREKFNNRRYQFEQLATIYKCTKKFTNAAIAFGDNASGVHGVAGLAWQRERIKIEESVRGLEKAYDDKYAEMLDDLADAMMELNICEAEYGVEDWYDRFGYMYFEFMKEKYARKD